MLFCVRVDGALVTENLRLVWMDPEIHLFSYFFEFTPHFSDNIVVMWIVLIRENVTAGVSGRIDKGTEKRLEMMWCQHGCHSCKEQEVYNAVRTTQLHTVTTETIDTPFTPKDS